MHLDDLIRHSQANARTTPGEIGLVEFGLDLGKVGSADAAAGVLHFDDDIVSLHPGRYRGGVAGIGVFEGVVNDIDEHLAQLAPVTEYRHKQVGLVIDEEHSLPLGTLGIHDDCFAEFRQHIHLALDQLHASGLHPGEVQQLLHHVREAFGLPHDDPHAGFQGGMVDILVHEHGFAPASDGGEGSAQFMGYRGDEVVLELFRVGKFLRHVVDHIAELADFIVIFLFQPGLEVALGNAPGSFSDLTHRIDDGVDEVGAGEDNKQNDCQTHRTDDGGEQQDLVVHLFQRDHISGGSQIFTGRTGSHRNCHDISPADAALIDINAVRRGHGAFKIGHGQIFFGQEAGGGHHHLAAAVNGHEFHGLPVLEGFHNVLQFLGEVHRTVLGIGLQQGGDH